MAGIIGSPAAARPPRPDASLRSATFDAPDPAVVAAVRKGVVRVVADTVRVQPDGTVGPGYSSGSGFIVSSDGLIVTNYHVVAGGSDPFDVYLDGDERPWPGSLVGYSECSDLAVLHIDAPGLAPLSWASASPEVGRGILAAGYPEGDPRFALMDGYIQREAGPWPNAWSDVGAALEHTAHIRHGDSGGPLVDAVTGEVVGVDYGGLDEEDRWFAIGLDEARPVVEGLSIGLATGSIGIFGDAIAPAGDRPGAINVDAIAAGSRAEAAGLLAGDVITSLDDQPPSPDGTMSKYCGLAAASTGSPIPISVIRGSQVFMGEIDGSPLQAVAEVPGRAASGWAPLQRVTDVAGFSPRINRDGDGNLVVAWSAGKQTDEPGIYLSRRVAGSWETERVTDGYDFSPFITTDDAGTFRIAFERHRSRDSERSSGTYLATGTARGWTLERLSSGHDSGPVMRLRGPTQHVTFTRDGTGIVYTRRTGDGPWHRKVFPAGDDCCIVVLRVDDAGHAHIAWSSGYTLFYATDRSGAWRQRSWVSKQGRLDDPSMSIGADQVPRLVFRRGDSLVYVKLSNPGVKTLRTQTIDTAPADALGSSAFGIPQIVVKGSREVVTWSRFGDGQVFVAHHSQGGWRVERVDADSSDLTPSVMIDDDGTVHLAFGEYGTGIWYTHEAGR